MCLWVSMPIMMSCGLALLMPPVLRLGAGPAIRRADRTVTGWTASGSYEVTSRPIAGRRPAGRHVGTMTPGQSSWGSGPPDNANTLTVQLLRRGDPAVGPHQEALAIVEIRCGEVQAEL